MCWEIHQFLKELKVSATDMISFCKREAHLIETGDIGGSMDNCLLLYPPNNQWFIRAIVFASSQPLT